MNLIECKQGSVEWRQARLGLLTASNAVKVITPAGKPSRADTSRGELYRLVYERLVRENGHRDIRNVPAVKHGIEHEPIAREAFRNRFNVQIEEVGLFVDNLNRPRLGCSPDGVIVGTNQILEIKSPEGPTHIGYMLDNNPEDTYQPQLQMQLALGGWECVHFFSHHPRLPSYHKVIYPDSKFQAEMMRLFAKFLADVDAETLRARGMGEFLPVAEAYLEAAIAIEVAEEANDE